MKKNLITGTRYLNVQGMLPFEKYDSRLCKKKQETIVLYRATPVFEGDDLVAAGVLMGSGVCRDQGEGVEFCVFVYNVQPELPLIMPLVTAG